MESNVIFAIITGLGGSVCTIRISGEKEEIMRIKPLIKNFSEEKIKDRFSTFYNIINPEDNNATLDHALITFFLEPKSFTGETVVEICLHNSPYIVKEFCRLLKVICNFRQAKAGEFTKRAFLNGKIDLIQSEGVNAMIRSQTKEQHRIANSMLQGEVSKIYSDWRSSLVELIGVFETTIDFSDEDIPANILDDVKLKIGRIKRELEEHLASSKSARKIDSGIQVVIAGIPNAGKSLLINKIAQKDVSIVTEIEGTTTDSITTQIKMLGHIFTFIDTAGIRNAENKIEKMGIEKTIKSINMSDIIIILYDITKSIEEQKKQIKEMIKNENLERKDIIVLCNKKDLIKEQKEKANLTLEESREDENKQQTLKDTTQIEKIIRETQIQTKELFKDANYISDSILISAKENIEIEKLEEEITKILQNNFNVGSHPALLEDSQIASIQQALQMLDKLLNLTLTEFPEIISEEIRSIASILSEVTGAINSEDVLDNIFSKFCIGK